MSDLLHRFNPHHVKRIVREAVLDLIILFAAYSVILMVRTLGTPFFQPDAFLFIVFASLVTLLCLFVFGVYQRIWSRTSGHGIIVVFNGAGLALVLVLWIDVFLQPRAVPLSVVLVSQVLAFAGFVAVRYRSRLISGVTWRWNAVWNRKFPKSETRVLVVGAGEAGQTLAWRLKYRYPGATFRVVGFVDDDAEKQGMYVEGAKVLGTRQDIPKLAKLHDIELIVVSIHNISGEDFRDILRLCEQTQARIKVVPNLFALMRETKGVQLLRDVQAEDLLGRSTITRHEAVDLSAVTGKVVLVSGAAGSIGSELARQMSAYEPVHVILVDNNESGLYDLTLDLSAQHPKTEYVPLLGDVTDRVVMRSVYEQYQPQVVFHAAAYKHVPLMQDFPGAAIRVNVHGTYCMADLARQFGAERFVLISSDKAVNPTNVMGATKRVCELIIHAFAAAPQDTLFTAVRFGNVLGSRGSVVPIFNRQIEMGGPITVTHPDMTRYFMSIPEAVNLVIHAACLTRGDDIFLLKMGEVIRIVDLAERMVRLRGLRPYFDIPITFTGVRPGEKLDEELYAEDETPHDTVHPHIVLLNSWHQRFNTTVFQEQLAQLTRVGYFDCAQATEALAQMVTSDVDFSIAAD
jgi:FlaA1/EpsC-like NDP-sugar epimerase